MSVRQYWDVWCDDESCAQWCVDATANTKARARENAIRANWTYTKSTGDRCPLHSPTDEASRARQRIKRRQAFAVQTKADQESGLVNIDIRDIRLSVEANQPFTYTPTVRKSFAPTEVTTPTEQQ